MNAYYDLHIKMAMDGTKGGPGVGDSQGGSGQAVAPMDMRLEMNLKANHLTDPDNMRYMAYSRITVPGGTQITGTQYYLNGYSYMDMMGQKIKYAMPLADIVKQVEASANAFDMQFHYTIIWEWIMRNFLIPLNPFPYFLLAPSLSLRYNAREGAYMKS